MLVLTTTAGAPDEQIDLMGANGDRLPTLLTSPSALGTVVPIATELYVNGASTSLATPNGSHDAPFLTVQAACDAVTEDDTVIRIANKGSPYLETVTGPAFAVALVGISTPFQQDQLLISTFNAQGSTLIVQEVDIGTINGPTTNVWLYDSTCGAVTAQNLNAVGTNPAQHNLSGAITTGQCLLTDYDTSSATITTTGAFEFSATSDPEGFAACTIGSVDAGGPLIAKNAVISQSQSAASFKLDGCSLQATLTLNATGGDVSHTIYRTTKFDPASVITFVAGIDLATVRVDAFSNQWMNNSVIGANVETVKVLGAVTNATLSVVVPAVGAGNVGYVDVSTLAGHDELLCEVGDVVIGNPQADLVAAGAGGGFINCRVSATNTIRCAFLGPLAGGAVNFRFAIPTRTPLP